MEPESTTDGSPMNQNPSNSRTTPFELPEINMDLLYYDTSKLRYLLVFNQVKFSKPSFFAEPLAPRIGTNEDVKALNAVFSSLKFEVTVYDDLSREQIMKVIKAFVERDHSDTSCVVVAILTHGNPGGELWAKDGPYNLSNVLTKFEGGNLVAVPKVFLVQACRGSKTDAGQRIQLDGGKASITVPTHTEFLILYSTVEDYVSFRDRRGSWMIQTFCRILSDFHNTMDLLHIITLMNHTIAHEYVSNSSNPSIDNKKQTSETKFTLTKLLKL
ncbi:caspase isoform X2 [Manduca sexta]|uniref:caspase isoform X2 n=1 Tax=Manduca sexta TaxID=7130 RepID=UPI00188E2F24|nr:caspase isoform X2 [Manduca sexta]